MAVRPNANASDLASTKAIMDWVLSELDNCNPVHDLRKVLEGELAQRSDLSKRALENDRSVLEIDALPEDQRVCCSIVVGGREALDSHPTFLDLNK